MGQSPAQLAPRTETRSGDNHIMNEMESHDTPALVEFNRLFRRWLWLWALLVVGITTGITVVTNLSAGTLYEAEALVVATELEARIDTFPGTASAIFEGGAVAEQAAVLSGTGVDPDDLIPDAVDIEPVAGTAVVKVRGLHANPDLAAIYANATAHALAGELNRVGPGLGTFSVHAEARVPTSPVPNSGAQATAIGMVIGSVLVYGLIALLAVISSSRRARAERDANANLPTSTLLGIGRGYERKLLEVGVSNVEDLASSSPDWLATGLSITPALAEDWVAQAIEVLGRDPGLAPRPAPSEHGSQTETR